jgi:hypothetical protein
VLGLGSDVLSLGRAFSLVFLLVVVVAVIADAATWAYGDDIDVIANRGSWWAWACNVKGRRS